VYKDKLEVIEFEKWNKKILNVYWIIALISLITEVIIYFLVAVPRGHNNFAYIASFIIRPAICNLILLSVSEIINKLIKDKHKEGVKYLIVLVGTLMAFNLVLVHFSVSMIYTLFLLPIMLSVNYGSHKIARFAIVLNVTIYILFVILYLPTKPPGEVSHSLTDVVTTLSAMISAALIVRSFINRTDEIINTFMSVYESERDLAFKNFAMEYNSRIEPFTGLYNHKTFYEYLKNLIEQSENFNFPLSLAVMDIDNFKKVNDTYGHSFGDEVIKAFADIIKANTGTDDYAARYGGEEFAIIFPDKDKHKAFEIVEAIRKQFNEKVFEGKENERFSFSAGIREHYKGLSMEDFFTQADAALYVSKSAGKNRTTIYEETEDSKKDNL